MPDANGDPGDIPRAALDAIGDLPDPEIDIGDAALQLARLGAPDADWRPARDHLSELARAAHVLREAPDAARRAGALGALLHDFGYAGDQDDYENPANANLIQVIARRRGLPVSLGVLWLHCARAAGWAAHGIDFPGHFLLGIEAGATHAVIDAFGGGVVLDAPALRRLLQRYEGDAAELRPGLLRPMTARRVLLRLQNNIKVRRLAARDLSGALACTRDMLRIAPDAASLWREAAILNERLDHLAAALRCHAMFLDLVPDGENAVRARLAMEELRSRLS